METCCYLVGFKIFTSDCILLWKLNVNHLLPTMIVINLQQMCIIKLLLVFLGSLMCTYICYLALDFGVGSTDGGQHKL